MRHPINMPQVIRGWLDIWVGVYLDVCDWGWWTWLWGWGLVMVFHKFRVPVPEWVGQMISFTILNSTIQFLGIPFCTLLKLKHYTILFFFRHKLIFLSFVFLVAITEVEQMVHPILEPVGWQGPSALPRGCCVTLKDLVFEKSCVYLHILSVLICGCNHSGRANTILPSWIDAGIDSPSALPRGDPICTWALRKRKVLSKDSIGLCICQWLCFWCICVCVCHWVTASRCCNCHSGRLTTTDPHLP